MLYKYMNIMVHWIITWSLTVCNVQCSNVMSNLTIVILFKYPYTLQHTKYKMFISFVVPFLKQIFFPLVYILSQSFSKIISISKIILISTDTHIHTSYYKGISTELQKMFYLIHILLININIHSALHSFIRLFTFALPLIAFIVKHYVYLCVLGVLQIENNQHM